MTVRLGMVQLQVGGSSAWMAMLKTTNARSSSRSHDHHESGMVAVPLFHIGWLDCHAESQHVKVEVDFWTLIAEGFRFMP